MEKDIKVGDVLRDKKHGDEWEVTRIFEEGFNGVCVKGSEFWNIGQSVDWPISTYPAFEILSTQSDNVNHPQHYGGENNPYEAIKVIEAWELGFCLGNAVKYISRSGKKDSTKTAEDLEKAIWYLNRELKKLKDADTK